MDSFSFYFSLLSFAICIIFIIRLKVLVNLYWLSLCMNLLSNIVMTITLKSFSLLFPICVKLCSTCTDTLKFMTIYVLCDCRLICSNCILVDVGLHLQVYLQVQDGEEITRRLVLYFEDI
ncbi:short-chain dehydrogenase reductase 3a-like [Iris pallida]|uniref:Short-chain dehydrogenase reductase 3a-like n=1 Tax=Iris pallida TaxID=29817 RepID=A0AAX6FXB2_IRIPA|nr:hypothetical protein M6B38_393905 [Iris pallida]KAJ6835117.1 hypothetical protein M6B38_124100 [Iris pallida]KAJ6837902.1 short-chain dehydrogenase reductase 3a-like [Iris pallida]